MNICYKGDHLKFMIAITLPSMILWVVGIPTFALILLMREKKNIDRITKIAVADRTEEDKEIIYKIKVKFGFLFQGYKLETLYWEVVIMYRKILIIMVCVFLSVVSSET